jgi:hypothetical protein
MAPKVDATTSSRPWLKEGLRVGLDPVNPDLRGRRPLSARTETLWHTLRPRRTVTVAVTIPRRSAGTFGAGCGPGRATAGFAGDHAV